MYTRRELCTFAATAVSIGLPAQRAAAAGAAVVTSQLDGIQKWLDSLVAEGKFAGLVAGLWDGHDYHVLCTGHRDLGGRSPMRPDTLFRVASVTKPVTAAAAMMLVDEGRLALDEPVDRWLPELRARRVVRKLEGALYDTAPARRPITLRDLLTMQMGIGAIFADPSGSPLLRRLVELEIAPGPAPFTRDSKEFMSRVGAVPLAYQPGERWLYHTGMEIAGVLIERATGQRLGDFLSERLFKPAGMADTSFWVPAEKLDRVAAIYSRHPEKGFIASDHLYLEAGKRPAMDLGGGGLLSTAGDFLTFGRILLGRGVHKGRRLLSTKSVAMMTSDQVSAAVKLKSPFFPGFWDNYGWGLGMAVSTATDGISRAGRFGWWGGTGTTFFADPSTGRIAVLMTQRMIGSADDTAAANEFLQRVFAGP